MGVNLSKEDEIDFEYSGNIEEMITQYDSIFSGLIVPQKGVVTTPDLKLTT